MIVTESLVAEGGLTFTIRQLKNKGSVIIVTHNMQQAARISDYTAFMHLGKMVEADQTGTIFNRPSSGRFG